MATVRDWNPEVALHVGAAGKLSRRFVAGSHRRRRVDRDRFAPAGAPSIAAPVSLDDP